MIIPAGNGGGGAYQNVGLQNSKTYRFTATIQLISASGNGTFRVFSSGANGTGQSTRYTGSTLVAGGDAVTEIGEFTTGTDGDVAVQFNVDRANAVFTIDNVSVKEVLVGDGDFTFSRGSNLAATRIGSDGLIEKGRENLYTESNNFSDSDWSPRAGTFAKGVTDPNGGTDAWSWTATNTDPYLYQTKNFTGVHCLSIYVKGVGSTIGEDFQIRVGTNTKDVALTGDWQRVQHFGVLSGSVNIGFEYGNPATANDVVHIYAAQLETGLVATEPIESGATTGKAGLLEDEPRFDYSGGATCPSLLLEPSRTNLVQSEYLNGISWNGKIGVSFDTNTTTSPEGLENSALLKEDSSNGSHFAYKDFSLTSGSTYTISIFAKSNGTNRNLRFGDGGVGWSSGFSGVFNLTNGTATGGDIESVGNGWYRCSVTGTTNATTSRLIVYGLLNTATSYQGNGTSGVFLYGFQIEAGSYVTSYIPNHSGGSVTRGADVCSGGVGASEINSTEGVLYAEISALADDFANYKFISLYDGTYNNFCDIYFGDATNRISARFRSGGGGVINMLFAVSDITAFNKVAITWKLNEFRLFVNGVRRGLNTSGAAPTGLDTLDFHQVSNANPFYGNVKQVLLFKNTLSDSELATLTTL